MSLKVLESKAYFMEFPIPSHRASLLDLHLFSAEDLCFGDNQSNRFQSSQTVS